MRDARAQVVVDDRERHAGVDPGRREEGEVLLVERAPVAAVDEHHAAAVALARGEDVDALAGLLAVARGRGSRSWCCARAPKPRPSARSTADGRGPARGCCTRRLRKLVRRVHPLLFAPQAHALPAPGRSEKENSTALDPRLAAATDARTARRTCRAARTRNSAPPMRTRPLPSTTENTVPSVQRYGCVLKPSGSSCMNARDRRHRVAAGERVDELHLPAVAGVGVLVLRASRRQRLAAALVRIVEDRRGLAERRAAPTGARPWPKRATEAPSLRDHRLHLLRVDLVELGGEGLHDADVEAVHPHHRLACPGCRGRARSTTA